MAQRIRPTIDVAENNQVALGDVSLESPDGQFAALVALIEADDLKNPAPNTSTPPWGEPIPHAEYVDPGDLESQYLIAPDMQPTADVELLSLVSDAYGPVIPEPVYENDDQYHGLGVPPGVPNYGQPIESGHSQINVQNPAAELGWDAWSGRPILARVARHENNFTGYSAGTSRGHMLNLRGLQYRGPANYRTQQARDLLLAEIQRRGIHNIVIADVPSQPYNEQIALVDPLTLTPEPEIGAEGVLP